MWSGVLVCGCRCADTHAYSAQPCTTKVEGPQHVYVLCDSLMEHGVSTVIFLNV